MESNTNKQMSQMKILESLMESMEKQEVGDSEYLVKNIQLADKIISVFQEFKNDLINKLEAS
tara:strand:- start:485 stop:670 length:186 start_codon:yes stop_codon:yes gene_type:complete